VATKTAKLYLDACCLIEAIKGKLGRPLDHPLVEVDMISRIIKAGRKGDLIVYTSMLSVAEVLYVDEKPPADDLKMLIERFLLSGRDGITIVSLTPDIATGARDLAWQHNVYTRSIDLLHVASAISAGATELVSVDGRLRRKLGRDEINGCRLIAAKDTQLLPPEYLTDDIFDQQQG
jgi:predicted nucleic acid-binding protein